MEKEEIDIIVKEIEGLKDLIIVGLLKDGVDPQIIADLTGISKKRVQNKFPMKYIKLKNDKK